MPDYYTCCKLSKFIRHLVEFAGQGTGPSQDIYLKAEYKHRKVWAHIHTPCKFQSRDPCGSAITYSTTHRSHFHSDQPASVRFLYTEAEIRRAGSFVNGVLLALHALLKYDITTLNKANSKLMNLGRYKYIPLRRAWNFSLQMISSCSVGITLANFVQTYYCVSTRNIRCTSFYVHHTDADFK